MNPAEFFNAIWDEIPYENVLNMILSDSNISIPELQEPSKFLQILQIEKLYKHVFVNQFLQIEKLYKYVFVNSDSSTIEKYIFIPTPHGSSIMLVTSTTEDDVLGFIPQTLNLFDPHKHVTPKVISTELLSLLTGFLIIQNTTPEIFPAISYTLTPGKHIGLKLRDLGLDFVEHNASDKPEGIDLIRLGEINKSIFQDVWKYYSDIPNTLSLPRIEAVKYFGLIKPPFTKTMFFNDQRVLDKPPAVPMYSPIDYISTEDIEEFNSFINFYLNNLSSSIQKIHKTTFKNTLVITMTKENNLRVIIVSSKMGTYFYINDLGRFEEIFLLVRGINENHNEEAVRNLRRTNRLDHENQFLRLIELD